MLPVYPFSVLVLALLQDPSGFEHPPVAAVCQDVQRIELSLAPGTHEICVSPGLLTGLVFDAPVMVDVQDELRFTEVTRSRTGIGVMPPGDMVPGERLRLTARYGDGVSVSFMLIAHSGQATRQVEVYRDRRTRESFQREVEQEHAKNQQLQRNLEWFQHQFEHLRAECGEPSGLRRLVATGTLSKRGILIRAFKKAMLGYSQNALSVSKGVSYRSDTRVAVEVWLVNSGTEPWMATGAALMDSKGEKLRGTRLWQEAPIAPKLSRLVVVEVDAESGEPQGDVTLLLWEDGPRSITIQGIVLPQ